MEGSVDSFKAKAENTIAELHVFKSSCIFFSSYYKLKSVHSEFIYLFIYLFNRFHHDYNAKIRLGKKTCEQVLRSRDGGAGYTTERASKLSVPLRKIHKY